MKATWEERITRIIFQTATSAKDDGPRSGSGARTRGQRQVRWRGTRGCMDGWTDRRGAPQLAGQPVARWQGHRRDHSLLEGKVSGSRWTHGRKLMATRTHRDTLNHDISCRTREGSARQAWMPGSAARLFLREHLSAVAPADQKKTFLANVTVKMLISQSPHWLRKSLNQRPALHRKAC